MRSRPTVAELRARGPHVTELRTEVIGVRFTPSERARIEAEAKARGVSLADLIRSCCDDLSATRDV